MRTRSTLSWQQLISVLTSLLLIACVETTAWSQEKVDKPTAADSKLLESSPPKRDGAPVSDADLEENLFPAAVRHYLLRNKLNELLEVKPQLYEEFQKFQKEIQNRFQGPQAPTISEVQIDGVADDDHATLNVAFTVRLHQAEHFEKVPLHFTEASLLNFNYRGDGDDVSGGKDPKLGYMWYFRGRGPHRLELTLKVPLQKPLPTRRLVVSLPASPICRMQLRLPYSDVTARVHSDQAVMELKHPEKGKTVVEAFGLGTALDLTWQPVVDVRPTDVVLESALTMRAHVEAEQAQLRVEQKISTQQGTFDHVSIRLPAGADVIKLDDPERQSYKVDPDNRQRVIVTLKEKTNSTTLVWTLQLPVRLGRALPLDGFFVEGARKQIGKIGLSFADGIRPSETRDPSVTSFNAGEFPTSMGPVSRAYQFLSQPYKLSPTIDEVKAYFEVRPQIVLTAAAQHLTLDAHFRFQVDRDSMNEAVFSWPNYRAEGWTIEGVDEPGVVENHSIDDKGDDKGLITVRLAKFLRGRFSVHLRARRQFKAGEDLAFSLPRPKSASHFSPTTLIVLNAENVETDLNPRGETIYHPLPSSFFDSLPESDRLPELYRGSKPMAYRIDTDDQQFGLQVIPQKQRIRTESSTEARWQDNVFRIVQDIKYNVSYERLSQARLLVPSSLAVDRIHFFIEGTKDAKDAEDVGEDVELITEVLPKADGTRQVIQLKFGEARIGHFTIKARFTIPFVKDTAADTDSIVRLPILASADAPFLQTRVSMTQSDWFDAEAMSHETWPQQHKYQDAWQWMAYGEQPEFVTKLKRSTHGDNEAGSVSKAFIRVMLAGTGNAAVRAQYHLTTRASSLTVQLPESSQPATFYWDQRRLPDCVDSPSGSRLYHVQIPEPMMGATSAAHLLAIEYQDRIGDKMGWSERVELPSPQLLNCSWYQVMWQVILPAGQHLLTYPSSASPLFRWQRTGIVWSRVSDYDSEWLQQWVVAGTGGAPPENALMTETVGNAYAFSQFDAPRTLVFQTLSSSMVFFFGAGISLAVGFVMIKLVVLRHVLSLLLLGLAVALVGLWFAAPLELLLQPMIAGLIFPAAAIFLDGWTRRRFDNGLGSFDGQADFPPLQAFGSQILGRQSDPNESTMHRPMPRDGESGVAVESRSGMS